jgi:thiopeptide-type bacteriocin biosynthesis protein
MNAHAGCGWTSWHAFHHGDVDEVDRFLIEAVGPAMAQRPADSHVPGGFFLRYWDGGPHIRLRLRDLDAASEEAVTASLAAWLREHPPKRHSDRIEHYARHGLDATGRAWHVHGEVIRSTYDPECDRYGGPSAMRPAEDLFEQSSRLAIATLKSMGTGGTTRLGIAFTLFAAGVLAFCPDPLAASLLVRRYVLAARWNSDGGATDIADARSAAESNWERNSAALSGRLAGLIRMSADDTPGTGAAGAWSRAVRSYVGKLRALALDTGLGPWATEASVTFSQLHMLNNRLGTGMADEYQIAWLLSLAFNHQVDNHPDAQTFTATGAGLGGAFHRASTYMAAGLADRIPRNAGTQSGPEPGSASAAVIPLPPSIPSNADAARISAVLVRRRSGHGIFTGTVEAGDFATLLRAAVGDRENRLFAYPAAGALPCIRMMVFTARVAGVSSDLFEYRAVGLSLLRRDPSRDELLACSPYTQVGPGGAVGSAPVFDATDTPLWVFVVADLRALTAKYGQRGYRFAYLQAGHAAQNVLLVAEAMGFRARLIGGFYDDALAVFLGVDGITQIPLYMIPVAMGGPQ